MSEDLYPFYPTTILNPSGPTPGFVHFFPMFERMPREVFGAPRPCQNCGVVTERKDFVIDSEPTGEWLGGMEIRVMSWAGCRTCYEKRKGGTA